MTNEERYLKDVQSYCNVSLPSASEKDRQDRLTIWQGEITAGKIKNDDLQRWTNSLIAYYEDKDMPFAKYLEGLL